MWEIAHRWHGVDQDVTDADNLPAAVKDTLRDLMYAVNVYLNAYDAHGKFIEQEYFWPGFPKTKFAKLLEADLNTGAFDKEFLRAVFIRREELPKWCRGQDMPLPQFWYPEAARVDAPPLSNAEMPESKEPDKVRTDTSAKAHKAALKRHEPVQKIKNDLYAFYRAGRFRSQAEAVRRFMNTRDEESLRPLSPTNAERTLKEALSKYIRGQKKR